HHGADARYFRRQLQQVSQQSPGQRPLAVELAGGGSLQSLEVAFAPVLGVVAAARLFLLERLLGLEQTEVARVLRDGVILLFPAENLDVILMSESVDITAVVILRAAGAAEDLLCRAGIHQLLLAERS